MADLLSALDARCAHGNEAEDDDPESAGGGWVTPVDEFLARQRVRTPVERFAEAHGRGAVAPATERWRDLLPAAPPALGQQYAFDVDLDRCTGCKACVTACHTLNGLDGTESWRRVGTLRGVDAETGRTSIQTVTHACHHCVDPACLAGCPVDAYTKDPVTGIVAHLDDQCIGCSYCTLTCPYEVPALHRELGIVRKCDLCADRLAEGEAPACVQGCPNEAISIVVVDAAELVASIRASGSATLVPGAPPSALTVPTTAYRSSRPLSPTARPAGRGAVHPAEGHTPLAVMLVLTQVAVGAASLGWLTDLLAPGALGTQGVLAALALGTGVAALAASLAHLGRPWQAWRALRGFSHSWLSREIVAFGLFAALETVSAIGRLAGASRPLVLVVGVGAVTAGVAGVCASVMVYAVTGRRWWCGARTAGRFASTALAGGSLLVVAVLAGGGGDRSLLVGAAALAMAATVAGLLVHWRARTWRGDPDDPLVRTAALLRGPLADASGWRLLLALAALLLVPATLAAAIAAPGGSWGAATWATASLGVVVAAELVERHLFFRACAGPQLPGGGA